MSEPFNGADPVADAGFRVTRADDASRHAGRQASGRFGLPGEACARPASAPFEFSRHRRAAAIDQPRPGRLPHPLLRASANSAMDRAILARADAPCRGRRN